MSANDFYDWKKHPVTEVVFSQLEARVNVLLSELVEQTAYASQSEMAEKAGAIKALRDLLEISFEDTE